ncbi:VOC family protein [Paracoccus albus]|uniref:VOC family protein n=1 Tax=Paracoccus albus TaxID=3017784 RepID=UPI0022F0AA8A|nr:VOC family protein [Paracoccus albus]WBU58900.1 VOC family protein [Paracoccus albus]
MSLEFDHIVVAAADLSEGEAWLSGLLDAAPEPGGKHDFMGTHNRLWRMGVREYLELIAVDPDANQPNHPRWFGLDDFQGPPKLVSWVCRTNKLQAPEAGRIMKAQRGDLHWRITIPGSGVSGTDGLEPLRIDWGDGPHPADNMPDHGFRLLGLDVTHPKPPKLPVSDPRIRLKAGDTGLVAHISTPHGKVTL